MKKNLMFILMIIVVLSLVGCGKKQEGDKLQDNDTNNQDSSGDNDNSDDDLEDDDNKDEGSQTKLDEIKSEIEKAYGENYISNAMPIEIEILKDLYRIDPSWVEAFVGESPMISVSVDTFIGIHPSQGNEEKVKDALLAYRDFLINESMQYPMNIAKVNAAEVIEEGGDYFFIMLGNIDENELDEDKRINLFKEQNQLAIDTIKEFNK